MMVLIVSMHQYIRFYIRGNEKVNYNLIYIAHALCDNLCVGNIITTLKINPNLFGSLK